MVAKAAWPAPGSGAGLCKKKMQFQLCPPLSSIRVEEIVSITSLFLVWTDEIWSGTRLPWEAPEPAGFSFSCSQLGSSCSTPEWLVLSMKCTAQSSASQEKNPLLPPQADRCRSLCKNKGSQSHAALSGGDGEGEISFANSVLSLEQVIIGTAN